MRVLGFSLFLTVAFLLPAWADADEFGKCPSCPSAHAIAEQVVENLDARPRPTIIHCKNPRGARAGGYTARCSVFFPAPGTPVQ